VAASEQPACALANARGPIIRKLLAEIDASEKNIIPDDSADDRGGSVTGDAETW